MSDYIKCSELIDFIADYLTGELGDSQRSEFERHLKLCPPCQVYLKTYQETMRLCRSGELGGPEDTHPVPEIPDDLVRAILAAKTRAN